MTPIGPLGAPAFIISDETTLWVLGALWERAPDEWKALIAWVEFHGIDPIRVPLNQAIVRNLAECRIEYDEFVYEDGHRVLIQGTPGAPSTWCFARRRVHQQGETPPMPFPDVILAHLNTRETA